jgi:hypothetical protein
VLARPGPCRGARLVSPAFLLELPPLPPGWLQVNGPQPPTFTMEREGAAEIIERNALVLQLAAVRVRKKEDLWGEELAMWLDVEGRRAVVLPLREARARAFGFWTEDDLWYPPEDAVVLEDFKAPPEGSSPLVIQLSSDWPRKLVLTSWRVTR